MIALLLNKPQSYEDWARWAFHHRNSHAAIIAALRQQANVSLPEYILDPINFNEPRLFLEANQQAHVDMDQYLGVQSSDLEDVDLKNDRELQSWIYLHWQEHQTGNSTRCASTRS